MPPGYGWQTRGMPSPRDAVTAISTLVRAGLLRPPRPDHAVGMAAAIAFWGIGPAGGYAVRAVRDRRRVALVDPEGALTFGEVDALTTSLAAAYLEAGIGAGDPVGVLCHNDRRFVLSLVALAKVGAACVLLNTGFAAPQVAEVVESEGLVAVACDPALAPLVPRDLPVLPERGAPGAALRAPAEPPSFVILTSGTTGRPKGAHRAPPTSLEPAIALLSSIPLKANETTVIAAPLFHAWGFLQWMVSLALGSTVVLTGTFDAESTLRAVADHDATALVAVPVMLRRMLAVETPYDTTSLRVVAVSGSALPPDVATEFMDRFGDVVYDLYGSTEVAWASIAGPDDVRRGSVGRPPYGTTVTIRDPGGEPLPAGETGAIHVENGMALQARTGDLGRFDAEGRLYVVGREDDMVVSGGENVFPRPVEEVLSVLPGVADVAVTGVPDDEYGQRLRAYVVRSGHVTEDDVRAAVRGTLARHYVPRDVVFVDAIPRNAAGKVVKRDLDGQSSKQTISD